MVEESIKQFDIYLISLDPTIGSEIKKTRPCIIISPKELMALNTVLIAPLTSKGFEYIFRIRTTFQDKQGLILLDQIRSVDKKRLIKKIGKLDKKTSLKVRETLLNMFS